MTATLVHYAYCGMSVPRGEFPDEATARHEAADLIRKARAKGRKVTTLQQGAQWEFLEPEDAQLVPDWCGTLHLQRYTVECRECGTLHDNNDDARQCCAEVY